MCVERVEEVFRGVEGVWSVFRECMEVWKVWEEVERSVKCEWSVDAFRGNENECYDEVLYVG